MSNPPEAERPAARPRRLLIGCGLALLTASFAHSLTASLLGAFKVELMLTVAEEHALAQMLYAGLGVGLLAGGVAGALRGCRRVLWSAAAAHAGGALFVVLAQGFAALSVGVVLLSVAGGVAAAAAIPLAAEAGGVGRVCRLCAAIPAGLAVGWMAASWTWEAAAWPPARAFWIVLPLALLFGFLLRRDARALALPAKPLAWSLLLQRPDAGPGLLLLVCVALAASVLWSGAFWIGRLLAGAAAPALPLIIAYCGLAALVLEAAGRIVRRGAVPRVLAATSLLSGMVLYWMSATTDPRALIVAAAVFVASTTLFMPLLLGVGAARSTAGAGLLGALAVAAVGLGTAPLLGQAADHYAGDQYPAGRTLSVFQSADVFLSPFLDASQDRRNGDLAAALTKSQEIIQAYRTTRRLPPAATTEGLQAIVATRLQSPITEMAQALLNRAYQHGGRMALRFLVPPALLLALLTGGAAILRARAPNRPRTATD